MMQNGPPETESNEALVAIIRDRIAGDGRITFAEFMELALYHPDHGYYFSEGRRPGRGGDFITAPESGAYFGFALARQLAECWERLGEPESWQVREYGAGIGGLAYDIIAGLTTEAPRAAAGLHYRLTEINPAQRASAVAAMTEVGLHERITVEDPVDDLPPITGVILANEVADAFPVHRLVRTGRGWQEHYVVWRGGWFAWEPGPLSELAAPAAAHLDRSGISWHEGDIADVSPAAEAWFTRAAEKLDRGFAIVIDYGYQAIDLFQQHRLEGTIRGYFGHTVTDDPFLRVGHQDLTAHVDFTALQRAGESAGMVLAGFTTQGAFLASLDLGDYLMQMQRDPEATVEDYLGAQAVMLRLIDPGGMGRFGVLIMAKGVPTEPPLRGFSTAPPPF